MCFGPCRRIVGVCIIQAQFDSGATRRGLGQQPQQRMRPICPVAIQLKNLIAICHDGKVPGQLVGGHTEHRLKKGGFGGHVAHQKVQPKPRKDRPNASAPIVS
jgi:hypothetical protein